MRTKRHKTESRRFPNGLVDQRGDTELRYAESVQDIHNGLFLTVTGIQENLTDTLGDLTTTGT